MGSLPDLDNLLDICLKHMQRAGWEGFSFEAVACEGGVPLADVLDVFSSKEDVLEAFFERIDRAVVSTFDGGDAPWKEALLEGLMLRFEALAPYRELVRKLYLEGLRTPCLGVFLLCRVRQSLGMFIHSVPDNSSQLLSFIVFFIYERSFHVWLEDGSAGFSRTHAYIDHLVVKCL